MKIAPTLSVPILSLAAIVLLNGCASVPSAPTVMVLPGAHKNFNEFQNDSLSCQQYAQGVVAPAASAVAIAQDRAQEKAHFVRCGVPCAPYAVIETAEQLAAVPAGIKRREGIPEAPAPTIEKMVT